MIRNLSVIIPSKTAANLKACVSAVEANEPDARIIVVDDGIAIVDRYELMLRDDRPEVRNVAFIDGAKPFIFARNCNLGIRAAGDDDVILLNDDALLFTKGGFTAMQIEARNHPEVGIIGAVTNITGQPAQRQQRVGLRIVEHFAFVCALLPHRTIVRVGLLDERYCLDYGVEDRDYCEAVNRSGLRCAVFDDCFVDHGSLTSSYRGDPRASRSFARNWSLFQKKWGTAQTA
jgi:GT2 family glycosyltransferase